MSVVFPEDHLLEEARAVSVSRFWHVCQHARHAGDPEGVAVEEAAAIERRCLSLSSCRDGMIAIAGFLDPVGGAAVRRALEPLSRRAGLKDERSYERRQADSLVELAGHVLDTSPVKQRPHLTVTATLGTLYRIPGSAGGEMEGAPPLGYDTVERISCDCSVARLLFESDSLVVDAGRSRRVISPSMRRALVARDGGCRWPGCTRRAGWCDGHHIMPWFRGGRTDLDNLVLLCGRHHAQVHEGRFKLRQHADGRLEVIRPPLDFQALAWPRGPSWAA